MLNLLQFSKRTLEYTKSIWRSASTSNSIASAVDSVFLETGWCTVLHARTAFRRGFFEKSFTDGFDNQQDRFLEWANRTTDFTEFPWSGQGQLGHPERLCWWIPLDVLKNLHPVEITTHLSLGPHYLEGYFIFHVPPWEDAPLPALRCPEKQDYSDVPSRVDPADYPTLQHEQAGSLISVVPQGSGEQYGVVSLPELVSPPVRLSEFKKWEAFLIRPELYGLEMQKNLEVTVGEENVDMEKLVLAYLRGETRWKGTYHETDAEEGLWHIRFMLKGTPREAELMEVLKKIARSGDMAIREPCVNVLREIFSQPLD